jgi:hypothetical protein
VIRHKATSSLPQSVSLLQRRFTEVARDATAVHTGLQKLIRISHAQGLELHAAIRECPDQLCAATKLYQGGGFVLS